MMNAARRLFETLIRRPPPDDRIFYCHVCARELRGRTATFDERARVTCRECSGREPEEEKGR